jgi:uncharacterized membrane protein YbhN (UPF0104 family)
LIKTNYFQSKLILLFKGILFFVFFYLLIDRSENIDFDRVKVHNFSWLVLCFILTFLNWYFEWIKWQLILNQIDENENPNNLKAFASGIIASFLTPSLSGNFLGRMFYYDKSKRWKITVFSLMANLSQFLVAIIFGLIAIEITSNVFSFTTNPFILYFVLFWVLIFFFYFEKIGKLIPINKVQLLSNQIQNGPSRLKLILISTARYFVFVLQYMFALKAFGQVLSIELTGLIGLIFLLITLTPSLFFGKILIRETIAVAVFSMAGFVSTPALFASFTTWFFNLFLTALIALFLVKKTRK